MPGVEDTDKFYDEIAVELVASLDTEPRGALSHWMTIRDDRGMTLCRMDDDTEGMAVEAVLASHLDGGAEAAAFITVRHDQVTAQVLLAEPRNSDIRRASIGDHEGKASLGRWETVL